MTDPITLLEDNRPFVPDTLPGERAAARAILEAAIQAEAETEAERPAVTTLPAGHRSRRRGRRIAALAGSFAAAAAAVTTGVLLWPSTTPNAMAGWEAVPEPMSPADVAALDAYCRDGMHPDGVPEGDSLVSFDGLDLVHVDQRGTTALVLYRGIVDGEARDGTCLLANTSAVGRDDPMILTGGVSVSYLPDDPETEEPFPGPVVWFSSSVSDDIEDSDMVIDVTGAVDDSVARVDVVHDGERLETVMTGGQFSAFWPSDHAPKLTMLELFDASGTLIGTVDVPVLDLAAIDDDTSPESDVEPGS